MKVLITAGGTSEYIDDVRILTNISSGKLGAIIAKKFMLENHDVVYIHGKRSVDPIDLLSQGDLIFRTISKLTKHEVVDTSDLVSAMEKYVPEVDVVIHAMAVSDFGFKRDQAVKLKSSDPQAFIDYLRDNIVVNPKVISRIKKINPKVKLVGFKFEVGKTPDELIGIAIESMKKNDADWVFANDKKQMEERKSHVGYLISKDKGVAGCDGKEAIADTIYEAVT